MRTSSIHNVMGLILSIALVASCSSNQDTPPDQSNAARVSGDTLMLTSQQQARVRLQFASAQQQTISRGLSVYGMVHVPPEFAYSITAPLGGIVVSTKVLPGARVSKGQLLLTLEHPDFVTLQQDYLTTVSRLEVAEAELKRQQILARDTISARKNLERAIAETATLRIQRKAISEKLALLHIDASTLNESNLSRVVRVPAPISGYVTKVSINNGMYVASNTPMIQLADTDHMHIELSVFERDVASVQVNQSVRVRLTDDPARERIGHVHLVGREVQQDRTVAVHAHLNTPDPSLIPGTTLQAVIETAPHQGWVVPESAVVRFNGKHFVFTGSPGRLLRREVRVGLAQQGMIELLSDDQWLASEQVVSSGASTALGAMVNTGDE
jgi:cobalt-zinc-cadmium efflux system membrane fusion protein